MEPLYLEIAYLYGLSFLDITKKAFIVFKTVLIELVGYHAKGQGSAVDGKLELFEQVGHGAYVVFMRVCYHDSGYFIFNSMQVAEIGNENIDTVHIFRWETHSHINYYGTVFSLKYSYIAADFAKSSKRRETYARLVVHIDFCSGI